MEFVLMLHSHLPWVLNHGRWPHGSDWLCEAALDTYLPLLESFQALERDGITAPVTIGVTPVLANMLASPVFVEELEAFFEQRLEACDEADAQLPELDPQVAPLVGFWRDRFTRLRAVFNAADNDIIAALRTLESRGRIEIIGSAATHGFLPLLARDESIRLQLAVGVAEHRRLFGRAPNGCWLPECAYRPRGPWAPWPTAPKSGVRRGIEEHLGDAGFSFFFIDTHLAAAGRPLGVYGDPLVGPRGALDPVGPDQLRALRTPYRAYRVAPGRGARPVSAFVRDPRASMQVWSRHQGYPGDGQYLEFHKIRWPGGLKLWQVTGENVDLGAKRPYDPTAARHRAHDHGAHFAWLLDQLSASESPGPEGVIAAPFDTELFGHWWFEGPDFIGEVYRELPHHPSVRPVTGSRHVANHPPRSAIRLPQGTWGANGDFSMWLGSETAWTWERIWPLEQAFWDVAGEALGRPAARPVLAQATRSLLLTQSSDWQFIISTGAVVDYAVRRFTQHCLETERLVAALTPASGTSLEEGQALAAELERRDHLFPDVLPAVAAALSGSRTLALS
jgi:1,4-alpha-glucan branching enzyme